MLGHIKDVVGCHLVITDTLRLGSLRQNDWVLTNGLGEFLNKDREAMFLTVFTATPVCSAKAWKVVPGTVAE